VEASAVVEVDGAGAANGIRRLGLRLEHLALGLALPALREPSAAATADNRLGITHGARARAGHRRPWQW
jgi:hypothetical protein